MGILNLFKRKKNTQSVNIIKYDFIAIDFETANSSRTSACAIGLAFVRDKQVVETKMYLIQPPGNIYNEHNISVHGIRPKDTENAPTFEKIWAEIGNLLDFNLVVCHNANFDIDVLYKTAAVYGITPRVKEHVMCTYEITQKSLLELCQAYGVDIYLQHRPDKDAEMCANVTLKILNHETPDWSKVKIAHNPSHITAKRKATFEANKISKENLVQDLSSVQNSDTLFYDKKVVITGKFSKYPERNDLASLLKSYGADINQNISKKHSYCLLWQFWCRTRKNEESTRTTRAGIPH